MSNSNKPDIISVSMALLLTTYTLGSIALVSPRDMPIVVEVHHPTQKEPNTLPRITLPKDNFSEEERVCLAKNIYFEARNQSREGQIAVALVTFNRVRAPGFPDDICSVVWQSKVRNGKRVGQFSWTQDGKSDEPKNIRVWRESYNLAAALLRQAKKETLYDFTNGALYYHADYVSPRWSSSMEQVVAIEDHIFYKPI